MHFGTTENSHGGEEERRGKEKSGAKMGGPQKQAYMEVATLKADDVLSHVSLHATTHSSSAHFCARIKSK